MNSLLLRLLRPRRRFSLGRVVGVGTWITVAFWSVAALVVLGVYRNPDVLVELAAATDVEGAIGTLLGVVPTAQSPLVIAAVAAIVVLRRLFREMSRAYGWNHRGHRSSDGWGAYDHDDAGGGFFGGGGGGGGGFFGGGGGDGGGGDGGGGE